MKTNSKSIVQKLRKFNKLIFILLFTQYSLSSQPTVKSGTSFPSTLNHGLSEDWIQSVIQGSDCYHTYFGGFSEYTHNVGQCSKVRAPIIGKYNTYTKELIWEREYNVVMGYGSFNQVFEADGFIWGVGGQHKIPCVFSSWSMIIVKVNPENGNPEPGYPKFFDPDIDPNTSNEISRSRIYSVVPEFTNGSLSGMLGSGYARKSNENGNRLMIFKLDPNGDPDLSFGVNGYFLGPLDSDARTVISVQNNDEIKYAYIGDKIIERDNNGVITKSDVIIGVLNENGQESAWKSIQYNENSLTGYTDVQPDATVCGALDVELDRNICKGWDIVQLNESFVTSSMFDYIQINNSINILCPPFSNPPLTNFDQYLHADIALVKIDIASGIIQASENPTYFEGADFYPDIEIKDEQVFLIGAKSSYLNQTLNVNVDLLVFNSDLDVVSNKEFRTIDGANCPFDLSFDCNDELIIAGNTEVELDDYFIYRLSNFCQLNSVYDIINNQDINNTLTWNSSRKVKATVRVKSGGTLIINSGAIIQFGSSWDLVDYNILSTNSTTTKTPRIIVESGGQLILDNCTLKGLSECVNNAMWDGVEVQNGGSVNLSNGATIMDAKYGILADIGSYNSDGNYNSTETNGGGIIQSNGATIQDCRRGIHFAHCVSNPSSLSATTFTCSGYMKDPAYKKFVENIQNPTGVVQRLGTSIFVSANVASGMNFSGCSWSNVAALPPDLRGIGIASINSHYKLNGGSVMQGLNYGIKAEASDPNKFIIISGGNDFLGNQPGIYLRGGSLHKITADNTFVTKFSTLSPIPFYVGAGIGLYNAGSTKILIEGNTFTAGTGVNKEGTYGIVNENTGSVASLHKKNSFENIKYGDQTQKNNGGLNIWCNMHLDNTRAWNINPQTPGAFPDQGQCNAFFNLTPENKFFDACTNPVNHIISTVSFDYWLAVSETDPPACNSGNISTPFCNFIPNGISGCDQSIELTSGNVNTYLNDVPNMPDGPQRQLLVNELIRYFIGIGDDETIFDLLSNEVNEDYKMHYALMLIDAGNMALAQSIISSLPSNSPETASFSQYFDVLVYAKSNNLSLTELPESKVVELEEIAELRTKAGYLSQVILSNYYNKEFLSVLETESGIEYRVKSNPVPLNKHFTLSPNPNYGVESIILSGIGVDEGILDIYNIHGENVHSTNIKFHQGKKVMNVSFLESGIYIFRLTDTTNSIYSSKYIKQ